MILSWALSCGFSGLRSLILWTSPSVNKNTDQCSEWIEVGGGCENFLFNQGASRIRQYICATLVPLKRKPNTCTGTLSLSVRAHKKHCSSVRPVYECVRYLHSSAHCGQWGASSGCPHVWSARPAWQRGPWVMWSAPHPGSPKSIHRGNNLVNLHITVQQEKITSWLLL